MNAIQKQNFSNGSFVLHKIPGLGKQTISAWFNSNGEIWDAQFMPSERKVKMDSAAWIHANKFGKKYK